MTPASRLWIAAMALVPLFGAISIPTPRRLTTDALDKQRPSWSPDGQTLLYSRHESNGENIWLYLIDPDKPDSRKRLTDRKMPEYNGVISPDGRRALFVSITLSGTQGNLDIEGINLDGTDLKKLVGDGGKLSHEDWPSWSPDSKRFAFTSTRDGNQEIYIANADGSDIVRVTQSPGQDMHPCWSPSGDRIYFASDRWSGFELASVKPDGTDVVRVTESPGLDDYPSLSPDGRFLAFVSNRDGNYEIYLSQADGTNPVNLSQYPGRDTFPTWTPDGRAVTFLSDRDGGFDLYTLSIDSRSPAR